jgi:hypothetical protein
MTEQHQQFLAVVGIAVLLFLAVISVAEAIRAVALTVNGILRAREIRAARRRENAFYR